nr:MAG TPA: hypothetical protein [Caudoviricetes sp.]
MPRHGAWRKSILVSMILIIVDETRKQATRI